MSKNTVEEKAALRRTLRAKLAAMSEEKKKEESAKIAALVKTLNLPDGGICIYKSLDSEVDTRDIIDHFIDKREVYLPVVDGEDMLLVKVGRDSEYKSGSWGILEPVGERMRPENVAVSVTVTPLLGADKSLARLGKGKGYYDRYFAATDTLKIGLAFSEQTVDKIPCEKTDVCLDILISADGILKRRGL